MHLVGEVATDTYWSKQIFHIFLGDLIVRQLTKHKKADRSAQVQFWPDL